MSWWFEKARRLQSAVRHDEYQSDFDFGRDHRDRCIVHAREDIILLVSLADTTIDVLHIIMYLLIALVVIAGLCASKFFGII